MSTDRFHKASKDGIIEVLKETTRRDCNSKDEQGMTPTLYAAFHGHLEALRLLCGRGGDPDRADIFGNTALHLAAAQGHKHIVTFLVSFGANIYSIDIDGRSAQELAGMNNRDDILRFLDGATAKLEASDKKKAKALKEKAKDEQKKRLKEYNKRKAKTELQQTRPQRPSMISTIRSRFIGGSMSNLSNAGNATPRTTFSSLISGGTLSGNRNLGTVQRKILANKNNRLGGQNDDDFKISEIEDGKKSVRSLRGLRRDSEVMYSGQIETTKRGRLTGIFNETEQIDTTNPPQHTNLVRSVSQPDFMAELGLGMGDKPAKESSSIFMRPGMGSIVIRKSISNSFGGFYGTIGTTEEGSYSIGSGESYVPPNMNMSDSESSEEENDNGPLERFLIAFGLSEYLSRFEEQKIDLDTLMVLTENDIKSLRLPVGPNRKLINAVNERKAALENPGEVTDSML